MSGTEEEANPGDATGERETAETVSGSETAGGRVFSQAVEDYVKAIYTLQHEKLQYAKLQQKKLQQEDRPVTTTDIARKMGITPAAASKMSRHLAGLRLLDHTRYHGVRLTPMGERVALEVLRHHRLLELYLHQALGYSWDEVHAEADALEHHISEAFEARLATLLGDPALDPHGDPIPTRDGAIAACAGRPLDRAEAGETLRIVRVHDGDPNVLRYLTRLGIKLQTRLHVLEKQPFNGPLVLDINGATYSLGRELAGHLFVETADVPEHTAAPPRTLSPEGNS